MRLPTYENCPKCEAWPFCGPEDAAKPFADELTWSCRRCGFVETPVARQRKRVAKRAAAVVLVTVFYVLTAATVLAAFVNLVLQVIRAPLALLTALGGAAGFVLLYCVYDWSSAQLRHGGFRQLLKDLGLRRHDR